MKSFRTTWIFAALVIAIAAYSYYDYKREKKSVEAKAEQARVFPFSLEAVTGFSVVDGSKNLTFEKQENQWILKSPIKDKGDRVQIQAFLTDILEETARNIELKEGEDQFEWVHYGLDLSDKYVEVHLGDTQSHRVFIGQTSGFDGRFFLRKGDQLLLGEQSWSYILSKSVNSLRDRNLVSGLGSVKRIYMRNSWSSRPSELTLEAQGGGGWSLAESRASSYSAGVSLRKVESFLDDLRNIKIADFVDDELENTSNYNLHRPLYLLEMETEGGEQWKIQAAKKDNNEIYLQLSDRPTFVRLTQENFQKLNYVIEDFLDGSQAFSWEMENVAAVDVWTESQSIKVGKDLSEWHLIEINGHKPEESEQLSEPRLVELFHQLSSLQAQTFVTEKVDSKLLSQGVRMYDSDNQILLELKWGGDYRPNRGRYMGSELVYLRSSLFPEILALQKSDLAALPMEFLLVGSEPPPQESETPNFDFLFDEGESH